MIAIKSTWNKCSSFAINYKYTNFLISSHKFVSDTFSPPDPEKYRATISKPLRNPLIKMPEEEQEEGAEEWFAKIVLVCDLMRAFMINYSSWEEKLRKLYSF